MSRITLLLLGSALMLIVAACESNGDDTDTDSSVENGTEVPSESESNGDEEAVTEDTEDEESDASEDEGSEANESDESAESDEASESDDEVAESGEDEATPSGDDGTATPDSEGTTTPEQAQPGPEEGMFFDLSVEEANELTDFEVKEPAEVPESVEFQTIMGMASQAASEEERSEEAATIIFSYVQPAEDETQQGLPVELTQSSELDMTASLPPETDQEEVTIGDREVTQVNITDESGNDIVAYMWNENEIHYSLAAILGPDLEESEVEDMLASIPAS